MNRRLSQLIALTILIGAPLLVSALTKVLPGTQPPQPAEAVAPAPPPPPRDPMAALPQALPDPSSQANIPPPQVAEGDPAMSAAPTLDTSGASIGGMDSNAPPPVVVAASAQPASASPAIAAAQAPPPASMMPLFREGPMGR